MLTPYIELLGIGQISTLFGPNFTSGLEQVGKSGPKLNANKPLRVHVNSSGLRPQCPMFSGILSRRLPAWTRSGVAWPGHSAPIALVPGPQPSRGIRKLIKSHPSSKLHAPPLESHPPINETEILPPEGQVDPEALARSQGNIFGSVCPEGKFRSATTGAKFKASSKSETRPEAGNGRRLGMAEGPTKVISLVDEQIKNETYGRLFAVIYLDDRQFKVTAGDLVMMNHDMGIVPGTRVVLDKTILVGGRDFSLVGRPVLPRDLVQVDATVVEKSLSKPIVHMISGRRLMKSRIRFFQERQTTLRINNIRLMCSIEEAQDRSGFEMRREDPVFV
eukprot:maker-scaffold304_size215464-snap-gene-0.14 protein:Tk10784 transcript:maker-scaffold304_size215464-snap-gene-0.14-mRNA-1 annotation:"39s ribosomal protein mitochondrial"